jgi:hypothetical protein
MKPDTTAPQAKQIAQVMVATLLVAGTPVAAVWWLRVSGTIDSASITLLVGVVLSLVTSWAGRMVWEKRQGSEDLLFSELMVWGYLHRRHSQRRLASAAHLAAPLQARSGVRDGRAVREQTRLLERLVAGMETRDPYLNGHSRRVARHAWMIARRMKLPADEIARVRTAAALHDVGKTKTPKTILHKAGALTDEEYRIIKLHPGEGAEMTTVLGDPELVGMIRYHHERLDGSGYPDGLRGSEIPLGARIIAVADTFDAITSARPYRAASPHRKAIDILHAEAGSRLDADVVRAFCGHYAGRGPVALLSFLLSLPERLLSWLTASAGTLATVAKVAAVAAIVGGAAATSATLGIATAARPSHLRVSHAAVAAAAVGAPRSAAAGGRDRLLTPTAAPRSNGGRTHAHHRASHAPGASTVRTVSPVAAPGGAVPAGNAPAAAQSGGGSGTTHTESGSGGGGSQEAPHVERTHQPVASEAPKTTREETIVKGKGEEAPAKGKTEEASSKGKSEEAPGKGKTEEASSKGKSEEAPGKGKTEEASSKGNGGSGSVKGSSGKAEAGGKGAGPEAG